ncbi:hypothetical protein HBI56_173310 [Parastagonospora nodorum]|nr:hypothetical protein HBH51_168720 [Parastagonospora nodorum]KAH3964852.1 hypothetical protein HBH52_209740 [Parastagonospora nodorum]KAH3995113.1 hypothetical protein HBI10_177270 [Parastagonospora nodorum]KAH4017637.1 hypothetical protein HBI13_142810 [Parastagonospora nodorum]KAH4104856.1 hypothetical protein HBH46_092350 [Parastagonospora nodorum]
MSSANRGWLQEGMIRGHMLGKNLLPGDEELGKKDDDHRYLPARRTGWSIWNHSFRWRRRRILLVVAGLALVYMIMNGAGNVSRRASTTGYEASYASEDGNEPTGPPRGVQALDNTTPHTFDGRIRYYRLARSLRKSAARTDGYEAINRNVLFAMASLKSAATLLPMVCEMSKWSRNHVHAAFMGREDISIDDILAINGVDKEKCPAMWHDARPDFMEYSSDARAQSAVIGGMSHIQSMVHPQVAIMDDSTSEEGFFVQGMRNKTNKLGIPLIELPKDKWENFMWMTRLDTGSLRHWHEPTVDILIQVPPESSSVLRLLKSIKDADYSGLKPPRIILELPAQLDESVKKHIKKFKWPPHDAHPLESSGLVIRRRINSHRATQEDAAIRFLELFYPTSASKSHVLLLSPQAQLSPLYYHFVKFALLEYKFSSFGEEDSASLMGISLELPPVLLDGKTQLTPPSLEDMNTNRYKRLSPNTRNSPFLWQAPNSHATLFFGDKWAELHSFLSNRVVKHQDSPKTTSRIKLVSETLPAWTEYMLEFMRARAYAILYPAKTSEALVTVHNELYHAPEEFSPRSEEEKEHQTQSLDEPFLRAEHPQRPVKQDESKLVPYSKPLHLALPFEGDLPEVPHLPHLLYNGEKIPTPNISQVALDYANQFRREVGGCTIPKGKHRKIVPGEAGDLFCWGDEEESEWVDDVEEKILKAQAKDWMMKLGDEDEPATALPEETTSTSTSTRTRMRELSRPTLVVEADYD